MAPGPISARQRSRVLRRKTNRFRWARHTYSAYVPEYTDCAVIFYIDKAGTMLRYDMKTNGKISYNACGEYISGFRF
ncbi:Uncharacterised protein [Achromobacter xylosoxidans]|nr:Uncharacterised protein [Achromobacter xylosoxidans]CUJ92802.1 Uncharacterised protein [Achromobacter xylosoxidans]